MSSLTSALAPPTHTIRPTETRELIAAVDSGRPLIVDLDGTLVKRDLLWEGIVQIFRFHPRLLLALFGSFIRGRAALKYFVGESSGLSLDLIPLESAVLHLIGEARDKGQPVVLATGAHAAQAAALGRRVEADAILASDERLNLTGPAKLSRIQTQYQAFDYVGNAASDIPLWVAAQRAYVVNAAPLTLRRALHSRPDITVLRTSARRFPLLRAIRPHQWAKNALLVLPALAAHLPWTWEAAIQLVGGFAAFSALASAVYLVNDLADLPHDRVHATKSRRPLAAGDASIPAAVATAVGFTILAAGVGSMLPLEFRAVLAIYLLVTTAYSLALKRQPLIDVFLLATLYTTRVVAGAVLLAVPLSRWFLAFSIFFFFMLALVKRVVELQRTRTHGIDNPAGRGYTVADVPVLTGLGTAAAGASSLVYCLYITEGDVGQLYGSPDVLWLGLPILLYWQARVWLLTGRGSMHEDPVVFALRDRSSHLLLAAFLVVIWLAR